MDDTLIKEQFLKLPKEVQQAIVSTEVETALKNITAEHRLHIDQAATLEHETLLVMLGLTDPTEYAQNIRKELAVDQETSLNITNEVNEKIFLPIRESMRNFTQAESAAEPTGPTEPPSPQPTPAPEQNPAPLSLNDIVSAKLQKQVTQSTEEAPAVKANEKPLKKEYSLDPYREPIE